MNNCHIGILGGGQLGSFLVPALQKLGATVSILDGANAPARHLAQVFVEGSFQNEEDVLRFSKPLDILTIEIENVSIPALKKREAQGLSIYPAVSLIELIRDRRLQKNFLIENNFPTADFSTVRPETTPCIQKICVGGYDGKGTKYLDPNAAALAGDSIYENVVPIQKEISVIVARSQTNEVRVFPTVEMTFDPHLHLVDLVLCPARISTAQENRAQKLATEIAEKLNLVGLLAIEMFIDQNDKILINEMAPRPHNSGHHTIEATATSQYEILAQILMKKPLGQTTLKSPAVMLNLIGEEKHHGPVIYENLEKYQQISDIFIHTYGKTETHPGRKMGHITVLNNSLDNAIERAKDIKKWVKVITK